jgi:hypothetical protein
MKEIHPIIDLTNQKFGMLLVIKQVPNIQKDGKVRRGAKWECLCDCGKTTYKVHYELTANNDKDRSCGCAYITYKGEQSIAATVYKNTYSDGDLPIEVFFEMIQQPCFYCGAIASNSIAGSNPKYTLHYNGLDRLSNALPHNIDNVVPCCKTCNYGKHIMNVEEFAAWIKKVYEKLWT